LKITLFPFVIIFLHFYFMFLLKYCFNKDTLNYSIIQKHSGECSPSSPPRTPSFTAEEHPNKVLHRWHHHLLLSPLSFNFCDSMYCTDKEINRDKFTGFTLSFNPFIPEILFLRRGQPIVLLATLFFL